MDDEEQRPTSQFQPPSFQAFEEFFFTAFDYLKDAVKHHYEVSAQTISLLEQLSSLVMKAYMAPGYILAAQVDMYLAKYYMDRYANRASAKNYYEDAIYAWECAKILLPDSADMILLCYGPKGLTIENGFETTDPEEAKNRIMEIAEKCNVPADRQSAETMAQNFLGFNSIKR